MAVIHNVRGDLSSGIEEYQSDIRRTTVLDCASNEKHEISIHQNASIFVTDEDIEQANSRVLYVQQFAQLVPLSDLNIFAKVYTQLFPYGHGHSGTDRNFSVPVQESEKHYIKLSSRNFAQDDTFPSIAFDIISRKRAMANISRTCHLSPEEMESIEIFYCNCARRKP